MKLKTISRSFEAETRGSKSEVVKVHKNADPKLHPFEGAREERRAVNAAKLDRVFAQPFLGAMADHTDGVYCSAINPTSLVSFVSGAADGEVIVWDLASRKKLWSVYGHTGFVKGVAIAHDGKHFFSCGADKTVKQWALAADDALVVEDEDEPAAAGAGDRGVAGSKRSRAVMEGHRRTRAGEDDEADGVPTIRGSTRVAKKDVTPVNIWNGKHGFLYIDHHWKHNQFATSSVGIQVWDYNRSEPVHSYEWGADSVTTVRFNPAEVRATRALR